MNETSQAIYEADILKQDYERYFFANNIISFRLERIENKVILTIHKSKETNYQTYYEWYDDDNRYTAKYYVEYGENFRYGYQHITTNVGSDFHHYITNTIAQKYFNATIQALLKYATYQTIQNYEKELK